MKANSELTKCPYCKGTGHTQHALCVRLRQLREGCGKTQQEFANSIGVTRAQVANLEGARGVPSTELLIRIADQYKVSVDWILGRAV